MRYLKPFLLLSTLLAVLLTQPVDATLVKQFNLSEMTTNADKIFRGKVMRIESGKISVGGGELSTVTYVFRVSEMLKGDSIDTNGKAGNVVKVTMLGTLKPRAAQNGKQFVGNFQPPLLTQGTEYLMFTTPPSSAGLSMSVGVGQGVFKFVFGDQVVNEAKNSGLFRDMEAQDMPKRGPIKYSALSKRIKSLAGK